MNDIRELMMRTLCLLGLSNAKSLGEQLVCLNNSHVGVRFAFEGVSAIWPISVIPLNYGQIRGIFSGVLSSI